MRSGGRLLDEGAGFFKPWGLYVPRVGIVSFICAPGSGSSYACSYVEVVGVRRGPRGLSEPYGSTSRESGRYSLKTELGFQ
jgi:hypothetical protein